MNYWTQYDVPAIACFVCLISESRMHSYAPTFNRALKLAAQKGNTKALLDTVKMQNPLPEFDILPREKRLKWIALFQAHNSATEAFLTSNVPYDECLNEKGVRWIQWAGLPKFIVTLTENGNVTIYRMEDLIRIFSKGEQMDPLAKSLIEERYGDQLAMICSTY